MSGVSFSHREPPPRVEAIMDNAASRFADRIALVFGSGRWTFEKLKIVPWGAPPPIAELRRHCRERLAVYKVPRRREFRADLPRSPLGTVLRHHL